MQAFKPGLGLLAYESNVPVVPAYIEGTYEALPAGRLLPKMTRVRVRFGRPIAMEQFHDASEPPRDELYRRIATTVHDRIERLATGAAD
jgi:1-acyl-sn-glycerol-3-phosphate acyltransferase